jgi:hypothetical protein
MKSREEGAKKQQSGKTLCKTYKNYSEQMLCSPHGRLEKKIISNHIAARDHH